MYAHYPGQLPNLLPPPPPPPLQRLYVPNRPSADPFWQRPKLQAHVASLLENVAILKSIGDELEILQALENSEGGLKLSNAPENDIQAPEQTSNDGLSQGPDLIFPSPTNKILLKTLQENVNYWPESISLATQAAQQLLGTVKAQLEPLQGVLDGSAGHERVQAAKRLANKRLKLTRNRKWRSRKRQRVAEALRTEREQFDTADREADEWRAKEIAKGIAKRKMEKMKALAEKASKEEKARRQEETEMVLIIEKLQELRALRIMKLKKQGRFFPEEDDQFMERVRAAVEEEERQAAAARNTSAAAAAILNAEEARQAAAVGAESDHAESQEKAGLEVPLSANNLGEPDRKPLSQLSSEDLKSEKKPEAPMTEKQRELPKSYDGLPAEFYQYYFGSSFDMGTLIEVRQAWDAFIMPGGSRIPQHWIEAPSPADSVWASYLVKQDVKKKRKKIL
ncbi:unnamed protein product [Calypogeia fissa]